MDGTSIEGELDVDERCRKRAVRPLLVAVRPFGTHSDRSLRVTLRPGGFQVHPNLAAVLQIFYCFNKPFMQSAKPLLALGAY